MYINKFFGIISLYGSFVITSCGLLDPSRPQLNINLGIILTILGAFQLSLKTDIKSLDENTNE